MNTKKDDMKFTGQLTCAHCKNSAPMQVVAEFSQVNAQFDDRHNIHWDSGDEYKLLLCPACQKVMLQTAFYHSEFFPEQYAPEVVWPTGEREILGLPERVKRAYQAASRVKNVDTNAFAVLLRRLLEIVCIDREAQGKTLNDQLKYLADKGELPIQLVELAGSLRRMGNIGAHASAGELSDEEAPYLDALCRAILEYVYHAPQLLKKVEERLTRLKR